MGILSVVGIAVNGLSPRATSPPAAEKPDVRLPIARTAVASLRASLRDPDSLILERVFMAKAEKAVCIEYRARNGFGGMNRTFAVSTLFSRSSDAKDWNRLCVGEVAIDFPIWAVE